MLNDDLGGITSIKTYYSNGKLANQYDRILSSYTYEAYQGGKVVFTHNSSFTWRYSDVPGSSYLLGSGSYCRFTVPSGASGIATLCIDSDIGSFKFNHLYLYMSSGWVTGVTPELGE